MNEDYAQPAWAKHHDRLAADLSRGIARLRRLLRGSVAGDSLLPRDGSPSQTRSSVPGSAEQSLTDRCVSR